MEDRPQSHRWVVDAIEESAASVEIDGETMVTVPLWLLPSGVRQGDVLKVRHSRPSDGQRSALTIEIDMAATKAALDDSAAQVAKIPRTGDRGGDIPL